MVKKLASNRRGRPGGVMARPMKCMAPRSFFFNDPATTEIYPLSLHDALPIALLQQLAAVGLHRGHRPSGARGAVEGMGRSEEHTSELQSRGHRGCRLLRE